MNSDWEGLKVQIKIGLWARKLWAGKNGVKCFTWVITRKPMVNTKFYTHLNIHQFVSSSVWWMIAPRSFMKCHFFRYLKNCLIDQDLLSMQLFEEYVPLDLPATGSVASEDENIKLPKYMVGCLDFQRGRADRRSLKSLGGLRNHERGSDSSIWAELHPILCIIIIAISYVIYSLDYTLL